jgi:hypothetical protein
VVPANYALTAISLPSGEHDVRFFYDPASIRIGATVSVISLTIMSALIGFSPASRPGEAWEFRNRTGMVFLLGKIPAS